ncbi:MAG: hypothetical protein R2828_03890 [Saprospiraceae bacterium]
MLVKKETFRKLAAIRTNPCVSIFIPTHRAGFNNKQIDYLRLKNAISEAKTKLEAQQVALNDIKHILQPAYDRLEDDHFYQQLSDGLAFFLSKEMAYHYELPIDFHSRVHVGGSFYLRPLLPLFTGDGRFFILALSQNDVRFFEATRYSITTVIIEDLVPANIAETQLANEGEASLQFHSGASGDHAPLYHGQGGGKDDRKEDLKHFFKEIDDGLMKMLHDEKAPLLIAAVDYLVPLYKETSRYQHIVAPFLKGNPEHLSAFQLHERAWKMMAPFFKEQESLDFNQFKDDFSKHKASISPYEIIPAAAEGRIKSLFLNKAEAYLKGKYIPEEKKVQIDKKEQEGNHCLLNYAATQTFLQGGTVYHVSEDELPFPSGLMNAVYRY